MRNIKRLVGIGRLSAVTGLVVVMGCSSTDSSSKDERSEGRVKDDKSITKSIEKKLKSDPVYKFEQVQVKTYGGSVQLSGFVDTPLQSQRAEEHSRNVSGVKHLINGLAIKPPAPPAEVSVQTLTPAQTQPLTPTGKASGDALAPPPATSNASTNSTTPNQ
jgi:hyperosmotically inducible periplasmic protein